jgi:lipopolysaccharide transport system permease protein
MTNYGFLLSNLVLTDFRIRYRNMSLGVFWSLLNPLITMVLLNFVFTKLLRSNTPHFPAFVLCALVPFNFFTIAWATSTNSIVENQNLIKRQKFPRKILPVSTVLANCLHFVIQIGLLLVFVLASGYRVNRYWMLLPLVWGLEVVFACGMGLMTSALDAHFLDVRYIVDAANAVLFWLVPIFYSFAVIPQRYSLIYQLNPVAAVVLATRSILLDAKAPPWSLLFKLLAVSFFCLAIGAWVFDRLERKFPDLI